METACEGTEAQTFTLKSENNNSSQCRKDSPAWLESTCASFTSETCGNTSTGQLKASLTPDPGRRQSKGQSVGSAYSAKGVKSPSVMSEDVPLTMTLEGSFYEEVQIGEEFPPEEVRIMVGRNRVRIVAEQSGKESVHKVVLVPSYIDSYSLRSVYRNGVVIITGNPVHQQRRWTIGENGHLSVHEDGSVRMTLDLPAGVTADDVTVTTVTKRYLVVRSQGKAKNSERTKNVLDTYELPNTCDVNNVKTRNLGENTLIVELGAKCLRPRAYSY